MKINKLVWLAHMFKESHVWQALVNSTVWTLFSLKKSWLVNLIGIILKRLIPKKIVFLQKQNFPSMYFDKLKCNIEGSQILGATIIGSGMLAGLMGNSIVMMLTQQTLSEKGLVIRIAGMIIGLFLLSPLCWRLIRNCYHYSNFRKILSQIWQGLDFWRSENVIVGKD